MQTLRVVTDSVHVVLRGLLMSSINETVDFAELPCFFSEDVVKDYLAAT